MERIQKILAQAGVASRRKCEDLIRAGRVQVNGRTAKIGDVAQSTDEILVDGQPVSVEQKVVLMLNKPVGFVTSVKDPSKTVLDLVSVPQRVYPAGRLDKDSEGLVILTNDGDLMQRITHPRHKIEKEYVIEADKPVSRDVVQSINKGIRIEGRVVQASCSASGKTAKVVVHEGRKHIVKRLFSSQGLRVVRLRRTRIGPLRLGSLAPGRWRRLTPSEESALRKAVG